MILVVTVGLVLGLLHQFSDAFKQYVQGYFGDYVACLLETGELPSVGGGDSDSGACNSEFEPFTLAGGRPLVQGGGVGEGGDRNSAAASAAAKRAAANSRRAAARRRRSGRVSSSPSSTFTGERVGSGGAGGAGAGVGATKRLRIKRKKRNSTSSYEGSGGGHDNYRSYRLRRKFQQRVTQKIKDKKKKKKISKVKKKIKGTDPNRVKSRRLAFDPKKLKKRRQKADVGLDLSIGDYARYLMIFGLLAAMFVFFGGQFTQITKSWEKGE